MPLLVEVCMVVAGLSVVAIAVATIRAMSFIGRATDRVAEMSGEFKQWITEVHALTRETREAVASAREVVAPLRRVVDRFEALGERTADLSVAIVDEVEMPLRKVVALTRGVKWGAAFFLERLFNRINHGRSATQERSDHE